MRWFGKIVFCSILLLPSLFLIFFFLNLPATSQNLPYIEQLLRALTGTLGTNPGGGPALSTNAYVVNSSVGQLTMAQSPSVAIASDQSPVPVGAKSSGATGGVNVGMITCNNHVFKHITTATDTVAVQGVTSQTVYVCGWRSRAAGAATWFLENTASTNNNCSSTNTQLTGLATEAANTGETMLPSFWTGLKNTSGNGLCINSTGTGGVDIDVWYAQF